MSVELVSAIFTGLTGLLAASAAFLATRSRRIGEDSRSIRRTARMLQKKFLAAMQHIFVLETELAERGIQPPARPDILEQEDDDDGPPSRPEAANASA